MKAKKNTVTIRTESEILNFSPEGNDKVQAIYQDGVPVPRVEEILQSQDEVLGSQDQVLENQDQVLENQDNDSRRERKFRRWLGLYIVTSSLTIIILLSFVIHQFRTGGFNRFANAVSSSVPQLPVFQVGQEVTLKDKPSSGLVVVNMMWQTTGIYEENLIPARWIYQLQDNSGGLFWKHAPGIRYKINN